MKSVFIGFVAGAATAAVVTKLTLDGKFKKYQSEKEAEIAVLQNENSKLNKKLEELSSKYSIIMRGYENLCKYSCNMTKGFNIILDPDMIADISNICNISLRDACLREIEDCVEYISSFHIHKSEFISDEELEEIIEKVNNRIENMANTIKENIDKDDEESEDEETEIIDDEDDEIETVSPKKLILKGINCEDKIFETDPDIGFEVIKGPDTNNKYYCIYAQNDAKLYNFLKESIKDQLTNHYVARIDPDIFEEITDDLRITVSFEFINENDAEITEVAAVIPFEIFNNKNKKKLYIVKDGDISNDQCLHVLRGNSHSSAGNIREENNSKPNEETTSEEVEKEEMIEDDKDTRPSANDDIDYLVEVIGYNEASLKHFINRLNTLKKANNKGWEEINAELIDTTIKIDEVRKSGNLDELKKADFRANIKALTQVMKNKYKRDIDLYEQSHNV
jgi:hypothetical protein